MDRIVGQARRSGHGFEEDSTAVSTRDPVGYSIIESTGEANGRVLATRNRPEAWGRMMAPGEKPDDELECNG